MSHEKGTTMDELLQEFVNSRGMSIRVDRHESVIRGVKLLGLESRNGRRYLASALAQAAGLYEGAKVNVNHPKGNPLAARDYQDRLGVVRGVILREGGGLFGDFHFNPKHALAEQLVWDAEHAPENVGFSHNVQARTSRQGDQTVVEAILQVQSVDLVADPATSRGLFEAAAAPAHGAGEASPVDELAALRAELDQRRCADAARERQAMTLRLLSEFKLPDPDRGDATAKIIVSQAFLESLLAAHSEAEMRKLVEDRAALVSEARRTASATGAAIRPVAREQNQVDRTLRPELDAAEFARAISC